MPIERVFLGWDKPALPQVAEQLRKRYAHGGQWDMIDVVVAVPGGRAGRRLLELIAETAAQEKAPLVLSPPRIITVGQLPEELSLISESVAEPLHCLLAWIKALRTAPAGMLDGLIDYVPNSSDLTAWLGLARDLERLHSEIAAEGWSFGEIAAKCSELCSYDDSNRWNRLHRLHAHYANCRAPYGLDRHEARRHALETASYRSGRQIVLVSAIDLPKITRKMLNAAPISILSLVYAPNSEGDKFDETGCLAVDSWQDCALPFGPDAIRIVDTPRDQAFAALEGIKQAEARFGVDQITIGLGDAKMSGLVENIIEISGRPVRPAPSRPVSTARPARLLAALADLLEDDRCRHFASLIRHPDLTQYLESLPEIGFSAQRLPQLLDEFISEHIPFRVNELAPFGKLETATTLQAAAGAVQVLLVPLLAGRPRLLGEWSEPIAALLQRVYGERSFEIDDPDTLPMVACLRTLSARLRLHKEQAVGADLSSPTTAADAIRFTLAGIESELLPEPSNEAAIEILGWLELLLDDAPCLIVTGLNEGNVPESINSDMLLPDRLRRGLGLRDNCARYARDAYSIRAMLAGKLNLTLICGRVGSDNDPLRPSRLLFACDENDVVQRALQFYKTTENTAITPDILPYGSVNILASIPLPNRNDQPLTRLSVTAFRDYLRCPYRFYLKHVLKLQHQDDISVEMDARLLGNITHDVLRDFAANPVKDYTNAKDINDYLSGRLEYYASQKFRRDRLPAVEIQLRQLSRKLNAFSEFQARHAGNGWRIVRNECMAADDFRFESGKLHVDGRIDRIDHNAETGRYLIIDYKITNSAPDPEKRHRVRKMDWIDLQLPLYRRLSPSLNIAPESVDLGYIGLSKDLNDIDLKQAFWTAEDYESANKCADDVMCRILGQVFWRPSANLPRFADGLEAICRDASIDRAKIIRGAK